MILSVKESSIGSIVPPDPRWLIWAPLSAAWGVSSQLPYQQRQSVGLVKGIRRELVGSWKSHSPYDIPDRALPVSKV